MLCNYLPLKFKDDCGQRWRSLSERQVKKVNNFFSKFFLSEAPPTPLYVTLHFKLLLSSTNICLLSDTIEVAHTEVSLCSGELNKILLKCPTGTGYWWKAPSSWFWSAANDRSFWPGNRWHNCVWSKTGAWWSEGKSFHCIVFKPRYLVKYKL